jgi:hypothetical protein
VLQAAAGGSECWFQALAKTRLSERSVAFAGALDAAILSDTPAGILPDKCVQTQATVLAAESSPG